jgi:hypothetical protein
LVHDAETFGAFFIILRLPFFSIGILFWVAVGIIWLPLHLAYLIVLLLWMSADLVFGLLGAGSESSLEFQLSAWTSTIRAVCGVPVRDYLGGFKAIVDWLLVRHGNS